MGHDIRSAAGGEVGGTTDDLYGAPISLCTARYVIAVALLNGWDVETGDVDGAYLEADLGGPLVLMRRPTRLRGATGADVRKVGSMRGPCVRTQRAMYSLPRAGFDWFAHADEMLVMRYAAAVQAA